MEYLLRRDKLKSRETFVRAWPTKSSVGREYELYFGVLTFSEWCWWRPHPYGVWCIVDWYFFFQILLPECRIYLWYFGKYL